MKKQQILKWMRISLLTLCYLSFAVIIIGIKTNVNFHPKIIMAVMISLIVMYVSARYLLKDDPKAKNE